MRPATITLTIYGFTLMITAILSMHIEQFTVHCYQSRYFFEGKALMTALRKVTNANFDDFSITRFLVPPGHYVQKIEFIDLFKEYLKIKIRTVHHTPANKIIELFTSPIISGCPDIRTLNNRLVPDKLSAAAWREKQFTDQFRASLVLDRITAENLLQLEEIFLTLFDEQSLAR